MHKSFEEICISSCNGFFNKSQVSIGKLNDLFNSSVIFLVVPLGLK